MTTLKHCPCCNEETFQKIDFPQREDDTHGTVIQIAYTCKECDMQVGKEPLIYQNGQAPA